MFSDGRCPMLEARSWLKNLKWCQHSLELSHRSLSYFSVFCFFKISLPSFHINSPCNRSLDKSWHAGSISCCPGWMVLDFWLNMASRIICSACFRLFVLDFFIHYVRNGRIEYWTVETNVALFLVYKIAKCSVRPHYPSGSVSQIKLEYRF